jgi:hypothetical protein
MNNGGRGVNLFIKEITSKPFEGAKKSSTRPPHLI